LPSFVELNNDQRREMVNTRQRFQSLRSAEERERGYRGSMVWEKSKDHEYLLKSNYDEHGKRRQKSLGRRSPATEELKQTFASERAAAAAARKNLAEVLDRQAAINRVLGLARVPLIAARILRQLDKRGLLGHGIRVAGTNALYCYEAACGVFIDPGLTSTEDIDLLLDSRSRLNLVGDPELPDDSLLQLLRLADRSFRRTAESFRAENDDGYLVYLIKPIPSPPWRIVRTAIGRKDDIEAAEIQGLVWLENAPSFDHVATDEKGYPLRIVSFDPRVFAIHKFWVSSRDDRDPLKKARDRQQAKVVAELTRKFLPHLPFDASELRMLPKDLVEAALASFGTH
jgi:hypothetical protein